jgi:hypothetical protein
MTRAKGRLLAAALLSMAGCGNGPEAQRELGTAESALNVSTDFAGTFLLSDPGSPSQCASGNVLSGWCGCPEGSGRAGSFRVLHDSFGGIVGGTMRYCGPLSRTTSDFGGAYQRDDPVPGGVGCRSGNSFNGGSCSCPTGTTAIPLRVIVDSSQGWIGSTINFCRKSSPTGFGGAYQQDDPGGLGCRRPNPFTGGCSCPSGYPEVQSMRAIVDVGGGFVGSTIHTCAPPVPWASICPGQLADPTGKISARSAIQACIDANYFGTLALPPGDFLIDGAGLSIVSRITITTQGTSSLGACLSSGSVPCARFLASPGLYREGGMLKVNGSFVTLDHIILDGNRSARVGSAAWNSCADGFNRYGFNAQVDQAYAVAFVNSASTNAVCGTGLEWRGDSAVVRNSRFLSNGGHNLPNMWSDGLTLLQSNNAVVEDSRFTDNSDVSFIFGGGTNALIQNNFIVQVSQFAFGGFMMDNFNLQTSGVFDGATVTGNTITCSPWSMCYYAAQFGPHPWYQSPNITGGTFSNNTVTGGYIALNVDGASSVTINSNSVSTGSTTGPCLGVAASRFNVAPDSSVITNMPIQTTQYTHNCKP